MTHALRATLRLSLAGTLLVGGAWLAATPAQAALHLMVIQEVFVGPPSDGNAREVPLTPDQRAQYVMLRMTSSGQTFVSGSSIRVEDVNGVVLGNFGSFTANVANGGAACAYPTCPAIVIGTTAAKNLFPFTFDKIVDGQAGRVALPTAGGRACFVSGSTVYDCVAWGPFNCLNSGGCTGFNTRRIGDVDGNGCDGNYGAAAPALTYGFSLAHNAAFNCTAKGNATDYALAFPKPVNNAGSNANADADADGLIDVLDCNDTTGTIRWPGTEVQNERVVGKPNSTISWDSQTGTAGTGVTYDVVRGTLANIAGFTDSVCMTPNTAASSANDATLPLPGQGLYFQERAGTGAGCVGSYGAGFSPATSRDTVLAAKCP